MCFRGVYYFAALAMILTHNMIFPVKGQLTGQSCESGDSLSSIEAELIVDAIRQQNIQLQSIREILIESNQERNGQQDKSLQAVDQRTQNEDICIRKVPNTHDLLNASFQQMTNHLDNVTASLQAVDRRSQEQDIYIKKQVQSIHALLNGSQEQSKYLNASFQQITAQLDTVTANLQTIDRRTQEQDIRIRKVQIANEFLNVSILHMKNQQDTVLRKLEAFDRRLHEHDLSMNQTQKLWKLEIAYGTDLGEVPVFPSIVNNWIVLMNRFDGSLDFNRNWIEYKNGFGDMRRGEFWLGNEKIHRLTNRFAYTLRIEVQLSATSRWFYAEYATFSLDSEANKYALHLSGYNGNAGDSLTNTSLRTHHNGRSFSTFDADNDRNAGHCARDD